MKKLSFLFVSFFLALTNLSAQDIVFTFNAKDASNTIDSIKATKVKTGETAFVEGANIINMSSFTTGTKLSPKNSEEITVYPNPFENVTQLKFYSNQNDNIKVSLANAAGQVVAEKKQNLTSGIHEFNISTNNNGLYILKITGNHTEFSQKIISTNNSQSLNNIEYNGYSSKFPTEKSLEIEGGEVIHFYVFSGDNITKIVDSPTESKIYEVEFYDCKDADGKSYPVVLIGEQWWMAENLAFLPNVSSPADGSSTEPYHYVYDYSGTDVSAAKANDNYRLFGAIYNWAAALKACPDGWHLPTDNEWEQLAQYVSDQKGPYNKLTGQYDIVYWCELGKHLKTTGTLEDGDGLWKKDELADIVIDDYGFSALPSGYRNHSGDFLAIGYLGNWWSATGTKSGIWNRSLRYNTNSFYRYNDTKDCGFSIRCVRNN